MEYILNIKHKPYVISCPEVMGILNCTPDSFYAGSRKQTEHDIASRANEIIMQGATMIDVGAMSTRPGGDDVSEAEEMKRLRFALPIVRREQPDAIVSVDTFRPAVARMAVEEYGVDIINDVGQPVRDIDSGNTDVSLLPMLKEAVRLDVPYILMSRDSNIQDMRRFFDKTIAAFSEKWKMKNGECHSEPTAAANSSFSIPHSSLILDPGYGFGKTVPENLDILRRQSELLDYGFPVLTGVSRKRMIWQTLGTSADEALNGTTVLNTIALTQGAAILRVHDVREAVECVKLTTEFRKSGSRGGQEEIALRR